MSEFDPDKVTVFEVKVANTSVDRNYDQFTAEALKQMAELAIGKPVKFCGCLDAGILDCKCQVSGKVIKSEILKNQLKLSVQFKINEAEYEEE